MCKKEAQKEAPTFDISPGAAMAHGCCGGFRTPQAKAIVIPIDTLRHDCRGDCAPPDNAGDDTQQA
jgi:hypothetical protein